MFRLPGAFAVVLFFLLLSPAFASQDDVDAGFEMGKYYVSANMLALDLGIISSFSDEFRMAEITDENYDAGVINDEDLEGAKLALAYTLWRLQLSVIPMCEGGLEPGVLEDEYFGELVEPTRLVLSDLLAASNACLAGSDFLAVAQFTDTVYEYGFIADLQWLSDQAEDLAIGGYLAEPVEETQ